MLQLKTGVKRSELVKNGIGIVRQMDASRIIVSASASALKRSTHLFSRSTRVNAKWKLAMDLAEAERSTVANYLVQVTDSRPVISALSADNTLAVKAVGKNILLVTGTLDHLIAQVIGLDEVTYVGRESFSPREETRVLDLYLSPNTVNTVHHFFPLIDGQGMTLSIKENAYNIEDLDLRGRNVPSALASVDVDNHATEMATIAAGAGNSFINGKGVAGAARITSSDFVRVFPDAGEDFEQLDAWVQNHSYGTAIESFYGALAASYDQVTSELPSLLHVFSSGNSGSATATEGKYAGIRGFANITGNFKLAKNVLTVGSVDTLRRIVGFSSKGPAHDGRVKPELVSYSSQGSSNSAALVSGVGLLLQQMYRQKYGDLPASALIKAILINSAMDAGPPGVDYLTGYGSVDAYRSLKNLEDDKFFSGTIAQGQTLNFFLEIPEGAKNLKVTLVWHDTPAGAGSAIALVDDLDLRIRSGATWLPWVLNTGADSSSLVQRAHRDADHLNNVEQVSIEDPAAGQYTIEVEGFDIPADSRPFYIAYQWDMKDRFVWTFPTGSDNVPYDGETGTYFFWQSTLADTVGTLEFSMDDGVTWELIADGVDLRKGYFRWERVPEVTGPALARCLAGDASFVTDQFTISRPLRASIGFNCTDSVMVKWSATAGADFYTLYAMREGPLAEPFITTVDTFAIIEKTNLQSPFLAIQPVVDGARMIRGPMFDYNALGTGCFLLAFLDHVVPGEGIYLDLQLGTIYSVSRVDFEREFNGAFQLLGSTQPESTTIQFLDDSPEQGKNRYRVTLNFTNGQQLHSEVIEDYYLTTLPFVVFPNPVYGSSELNIFSKIFKDQLATLRMYRSDGSIALLAQFSSDREAVPLQNMAPGFYLYTITSEDGVFTGRIVVK